MLALEIVVAILDAAKNWCVCLLSPVSEEIVEVTQTYVKLISPDYANWIKALNKTNTQTEIASSENKPRDGLSVKFWGIIDQSWGQIFELMLRTGDMSTELGWLTCRRLTSVWSLMCFSVVSSQMQYEDFVWKSKGQDGRVQYMRQLLKPYLRLPYSTEVEP